MPKLTYNQIAAKKEFLPFFVYDYGTIRGQVLKLKRYLPSNVKVYYSVKANPNVAILRIMKNSGFGAEIVSEGELMVARKAGFNPKDIIFGGAKKSDEDFSVAIKERIGLVSLESLAEIGRFNRIAGAKRLKPAVILRLSLKNAGLQRSGNDPRTIPGFGISPQEFKKIIPNFFVSFPNLNLKGVHIYEANRITDSRILTAKIDDFFSFMSRLPKNLNFKAQIFDIGGGFGSTPSRELSVSDFGRDLRSLIGKHRLNDNLIILELGRYLVNSSGYFISPVIDAQKSGDKNFLVIHGLINHLLRIFDKSEAESRFKEAPGNYPVNILPERKSRRESFIICGQLSSLADTFGRRLDCRFSLPCPQKGDLVIIGHVGSYGLTQSLVFFGSRPVAAEFLLINGKLELIRDKGKAEDFLRRQRIPGELKIKNERQR